MGIGQGHTLLNVSTFFNPLTPMSDQEKTSPYNLSTISSRKVMRIKQNMIHTLALIGHEIGANFRSL